MLYGHVGSKQLTTLAMELKGKSATMRRFPLTILVALLFAGITGGQEITLERTATADQKAVLKIEHEKLRAMFDGGAIAAAWYELHDADDIAYTGIDGRTVTKAEHVANYRSGEHKAAFEDHFDYRVRIYNEDTAVVTYLGYTISGYGGKLSNYHLAAATDVFVKQNGEWRTVVHQVTGVPTP